MDSRISKKQLKAFLREDIEAVLPEVVEAMNQARPGHIIDDSEELVRVAAGEFRRRLFEKALELRSNREVFSPPPSQDEQVVRWRIKGAQTIHVTTVNGSLTIRRRVYWANQHGCCAPLDRWLGLTQKYSQGVREMVARLGLDSSYRKAAADLRCLAQIRLSGQSFREVFQREGQQVRQAQRTDAYGPTFKAQEYRPRPAEPTCLIIGADGFHVPLITDQEKRQRREKAKHRRQKLRRQGHTLKKFAPASAGRRSEVEGGQTGGLLCSRQRPSLHRRDPGEPSGSGPSDASACRSASTGLSRS